MGMEEMTAASFQIDDIVKLPDGKLAKVVRIFDAGMVIMDEGDGLLKWKFNVSEIAHALKEEIVLWNLAH
ncbi:Uncharacterised protein [uncultured archaeon]|nr:Uncharacterised protein [uncultured archaeon]